MAKTNRALKAKTTTDGTRLYKPGDLVDYHRPQTSKDFFGGWNGPHPVLRNEPDQGKVILKNGGNEIHVRYPDARLTLYIETLHIADVYQDNNAMEIILNFIDELSEGKTPETFGYVEVRKDKTKNQQEKPELTLSQASKRSPKVFLALQFVIRNYFRINDVFAIRLGKGLHTVQKCSLADSSVLIYYFNHQEPTFHYYETKDTALDIRTITQSTKSRTIQCMTRKGVQGTFDEGEEIAKSLMPQHPESSSTPDDDSSSEPELDTGGPLATIHEDEEEHETVDYILELFYAELIDPRNIEEDPLYCEELCFPVQVLSENNVLFMTQDEECEVSLICGESDKHISYEEFDDEDGNYVELCFTTDMAKVILSEQEHKNLDVSKEIATLRVYISENVKKAVVIKEDDLLTKKEILERYSEVAEASISEIKKWLHHKCFKKCLLKDAQNIMTSRYVAKWKWMKDATGKYVKIIRMRLCLRGFMDIEAFSLDTFSGTAKRSSQRTLASEAACHEDWIIASLDIDTAFLQGFTYKELAEATGEKERVVCFRLPPGSAILLRQFPGFEDFDETKHCLQCIKPGTGTKDAPRAFSLKLHKTTKNIGLQSTSYDHELEIKKDLMTAKHVDDINMAGTERMIDLYTSEVEKVFGKCKLNKQNFTNCGVRYIQHSNGDITTDQDAYIKTLRPIVSPELTGAAAERDASKNVTDLFVSLRGALAYTTLTQAWTQVYIVALQRIQQPTNLHVRRLNAITRKLQKEPKTLLFPAMICTGQIDLHVDSGYRRMIEVDDEKGYGMRGLCLLRRGERRDKKGPAIHLLESICKSHKLTIRSSYAAETLSAAHGMDDAFPTIITLEEIRNGILTPEQLKFVREKGGIKFKVVLTTDAESVYKSLTSRDLKVPSEKTLLGHISWIRELLQFELIDSVQWCDTRDMAADGHTKGTIDRTLLLDAMNGKQTYRHPVKRYSPFRKRMITERALIK